MLRINLVEREDLLALGALAMLAHVRLNRTELEEVAVARRRRHHDRLLRERTRQVLARIVQLLVSVSALLTLNHLIVIFFSTSMDDLAQAAALVLVVFVSAPPFVARVSGTGENLCRAND